MFTMLEKINLQEAFTRVVMNISEYDTICPWNWIGCKACLTVANVGGFSATRKAVAVNREPFW